MAKKEEYHRLQSLINKGGETKEVYELMANHNLPSYITDQNFKKMNEEITTIKITLSEHGKDIEYIRKNSDDVKKKMDDFINRADDCYAGKTSVNKLDCFVNKVFWTSLTSLVGFLMTMIWFLVNYILNR